MLPLYYTGNAATPKPATYILRLDNQDWLRGALFEALNSLAIPENWEQVGDITPQDASSFGAYIVQYCDLAVDMIGMIMPFAGHAADIPVGALLCNGTELDTTVYPQLAYILGWSGDPEERLAIPDLRGSFIVGVNSATEGGLKPARQGYAVGAHGANEFINLTTEQLPSHSHTTVPHTHIDAGHTHGYIPALPSFQEVTIGVPAPAAIPGASATAPGFASIQNATVTVNETGDAEQIDIRPPFYAFCWIIIAQWGAP